MPSTGRHGTRNAPTLACSSCGCEYWQWRIPGLFTIQLGPFGHNIDSEETKPPPVYARCVDCGKRKRLDRLEEIAEELGIE